VNDIISEISGVGWCFDNSYARLPGIMMSHLAPVPVKIPKLIILNHSLSKELGLNFSTISEKHIAAMFSGNLLPEGSYSIAQAYAGHQFGYFTNLGDGRAVLMGEHITPENKRVDIQFKGSGRTPYSRDGDGRAALGPMLREYIISEAIHALGIPTTRSIAVVTTGEDIMREAPLPGAILTRVAASHIRVGTFQYASMRGDVKTLQSLVDYSVNRHYSNIKINKNRTVALLKAVIEKQAELITDWMRVGFIHGVMNTDNMTVSGETIDYGPCAFMDTYNPKTVFSSIDHGGRYAYANQPVVAHWNLSRFAETLLPLIDKKQDKAIKIAEEIINDFNEIYKKNWIKMMRKKIGLFGEESSDEKLIKNLLLWMYNNKVDYTNLFCSLMSGGLLEKNMFRDVAFLDWHNQWQARIMRNKKPMELSLNLMHANNPLIIPRNHRVEEVLAASDVGGSLMPMKNLLKFLKKPYSDQLGITKYQSPSSHGAQAYKTFCGT